VTFSDSNIFNDTARRAASATAELLVKLTIINCHFISASGSLNVCTNIINSIVVKHYCRLDVTYQIRF